MNIFNMFKAKKNNSKLISDLKLVLLTIRTTVEKHIEANPTTLNSLGIEDHFNEQMRTQRISYAMGLVGDHDDREAGDQYNDYMYIMKSIACNVDISKMSDIMSARRLAGKLYSDFI